MKIWLSVPGPSISRGTLRGVCLATDGRHEVEVLTGSCAWDGFNGPWVDALNCVEAGEPGLFAMFHADVAPPPGSLDTLVEEMERTEADLISVVIPMKDGRGACSCGIGLLDNPWRPLRRLMMREVMNLPGTFGAADLGYPGHPLLHNHGCFIADIRREVFHRTNSEGELLARFEFPRRVIRDAVGKLSVQGESEDWFFSRQLHALGVKTLLTRKVALGHLGELEYRNDHAWGANAYDVEAGMTEPIGAIGAEVAAR